MEKVTGIGGFFFKSKDPDTLNQWYAENLGITQSVNGDTSTSWWTQAAPSIFVAESNECEIGKFDKPFYINFTVENLEAMIKQLEDNSIEIFMKHEETNFGKFARIYDPEGNLIELWEPSAEVLSHKPSE